MSALIRRARTAWSRLRGSLWFIPGVMASGSVVLALVTLWIDAEVVTPEVARNLWFVFSVGAEGVRGVLSAIAGSIITVTGVVFSITVVALQLASTQYSPRVLRTFLTDRATHVVLGVFISTFTYSLLILRTVRAESDQLPAFVPSVSVTVALGLCLASVGCLIFFVHHIAQSIRASVIVERLTADAVDIARRAFPRELGHPAPRATPLAVQEFPEWTVTAPAHGYLATVEEGALAELAEHGPIAVRMLVQVGDFVRSGDAVAAVRSRPDAERDAIVAHVRSALALENEPSGPQDIMLGVTRLSDVAIKALSPGINDPATASTCLDGLSEVLLAVARREPPETTRVIVEGCVTLEAARPSFAELAAVAFGGARHYGADDPRMAIKLLRTARAVGVRVTGDARRVMQREAELTLAAARERIDVEHERDAVVAEAERILADLAAPTPSNEG